MLVLGLGLGNAVGKILVWSLVLQGGHKLIELFYFNGGISGFSYHCYNKMLLQNHPFFEA